LRSAINAIYDEAARRAEMQLLMARAEAEAEENDIEEMLLMGEL
jgi:hypothetical protein